MLGAHCRTQGLDTAKSGFEMIWFFIEGDKTAINNR